MRGVTAGLLGSLTLALGLASAAALGDTSPHVVLATPGEGGGAVERYTIRFSEPMVPLGDPRAAAPAAVSCPVAGTGRWVDPQTWVHEFARGLPGGIACTFTLDPMLKSLRGAALSGDRRFVIDTGGPSARAVLPARFGGEIEEGQVFLVAANVVPTRASVAANAYCAVDGIGEKIAVDLLAPDVPAKLVAGLGADRYEVRNFLAEAGLPEAQQGDAAARARVLRAATALKCRRPLPPGRDMALVWDGAIAAADGRTAGADQRFDYSVRDAFAARFECARVNPQAGCSPVQPAFVRFTAPIPLEQAKAIRLEAGGKAIAPLFEKQTSATVSEVKFAAPLPAGVSGRILLPAGVRDESGRPLANQRRFPLAVRIDVAPSLVKFAADFGILEAGEGGVLPVTVRNVEPALRGATLAVGGRVARIDGDDGAIARWLRRIAKAGEGDFREEKRGATTVTVNHTGAAPILTAANGAGAATPLSLALPGKGREFEVVGVPLKAPGFYVVELASPMLGRSLLGREAPRYVAAGALVTNLGVHFKWGRGVSLAWVTALDSGRPAAGAAVRVTDSCSGRTLAQGTSDAAGRLVVRGLPEPKSYGDCDDGEAHPLMVSARKGGDLGFTMTQWAEGIRPYDFDLPFGWSAPEDIVHTVMDRTLMRAGETVHMKHVLRRPVARGFASTGALRGTLRLVHRGSDTQFDLPLAVGPDGIGETEWSAPPGAPQGDYDLRFQFGERTVFSNQSIRVDEYRLPTMRATIAGPKGAAIRPAALPLDLYVGYLSGGGAANMPVSIRTAFAEDESWDPLESTCRHASLSIL